MTTRFSCIIDRVFTRSVENQICLNLSEYQNKTIKNSHFLPIFGGQISQGEKSYATWKSTSVLDLFQIYEFVVAESARAANSFGHKLRKRFSRIHAIKHVHGIRLLISQKVSSAKMIHLDRLRNI